MGRRMSEAIAGWLRDLKDRRCEVSPKTVIMATTRRLRQRLIRVARGEGHEFKTDRSCRDIGIDTALGRRLVGTLGTDR